jgi:hypothetical protein
VEVEDVRPGEVSPGAVCREVEHLRLHVVRSIGLSETGMGRFARAESCRPVSE